MYRQIICSFLIAFALFAITQNSERRFVYCQDEVTKSNISARMIYVDAVQRDELDAVTSVDISADGNFLYSAAYQADAVSVFKRDHETGQLEHLQSEIDAEDLNSVVAFRLSPDGNYGVATAFRANTVVLFQRDAETGLLTKLDVVKNGEKQNDLTAAISFTIDVAWSADSRFAYVIAPSSGTLSVFEIVDNSLKLLQVASTEDNVLSGARGIAFDPDGTLLYVAANLPGTLSVFKVNPQTGLVELQQTFRDEEEGTKSLGGAFSVKTDPEGKQVYVSCGRFGGDDAITVFSKQSDGTLKPVQSLVDGSEQLSEFEGGNEIIIAQDGIAVYAAATRSNSLSVFIRDKETGFLRQVQSLSGTGAKEGAPLLSDVSGLVVSPDGLFVYTASEGDDSIAIFRRFERQK